MHEKKDGEWSGPDRVDHLDQGGPKFTKAVHFGKKGPLWTTKRTTSRKQMFGNFRSS